MAPFEVGDVVRHKFYPGLLGTVQGFAGAGDRRSGMARVLWEGGNGTARSSYISALGVEPNRGLAAKPLTAEDCLSRAKFKAGDVVRHKFYEGLVGTVQGFVAAGDAWCGTAKVMWENGNMVERSSYVGVFGLERIESTYWVTLHAKPDGLECFTVQCTNMAGDVVAVVRLRAGEHRIANLRAQLLDQLDTSKHKVRLLLPDGTHIFDADATIAEVFGRAPEVPTSEIATSTSLVEAL